MSAAKLPAIFQGIPLNAVVQVLTHLQATQYTSLAGRFLFFYDFVLTLPDEIAQVWYAPWSIVKVIYLFNRYLIGFFLLLGLYARGGVVANHSTSFCNGFLWFEAFMNAFSYGSIHWLVALRVWTLWGQKRTMLLSLFALWTVCAIGSLLFTVLVILNSLPTSGAIGGFCAFVPPTGLISVAKLPNLLMDSILFALVLIKMFIHHKKNVSTPVLTKLYRDGIIYFIVNASCALFSIYVWTSAPVTLNGLPSTFTLAITNVAAFRLVLSLRTTSQKIQDNATQASPDDSMVAHPRTFWTTTFGGDVFEDAEFAREKAEPKRNEKRISKESFIQYYEEPVHPQEHLRLGASGVQWNFTPEKRYMEAEADLEASAADSHSHHQSISDSSSYSSASLLNQPSPSPPQVAITLPPLSMRFRNEYMAQRTENGMIVERSPETALSGSTRSPRNVPEGPDSKLYSPFTNARREERERERRRASRRLSVTEDWISPLGSGSAFSPDTPTAGPSRLPMPRARAASVVSPTSAKVSPRSMESQLLNLSPADQAPSSISSTDTRPRVALPVYRPKKTSYR